MTTYVALVYESKDAPRDASKPDFASYIQPYADFGNRARSAITGGAILHHEHTATTISVTGGHGGAVVMHDGPYVECKEMLGGFYLLQAADLDEALALAAQIPAAWDGGRVEIRPTMSM